MKIVEMNGGEKADYSLKKNKLTINDEITLNLDKCQRDYEVRKDIMTDGDGSLIIGAGRYYVAQIVIPATEYEETESASDDEEGGEKQSTRVAKPLNTDEVELMLFGIEGILN
jgi:hypothetical protein